MRFDRLAGKGTFMIFFENVTRRILLRLIIVLGFLSLTWPNWVSSKILKGVVSDPLAVKLANLSSCKPSASIVGKAYLLSHPQEANIRVLVNSICSESNTLRAKFLRADPLVLRKILRVKQQSTGT